VDFSVRRIFLPACRDGLKVKATAAAFPGRDFLGTVTGVDSRIDPVSRSVTVRAAVPNADLALKRACSSTSPLARDEHQALMVPEAALVPEQSRSSSSSSRMDGPLAARSASAVGSLGGSRSSRA